MAEEGNCPCCTARQNGVPLSSWPIACYSCSYIFTSPTPSLFTSYLSSSRHTHSIHTLCSFFSHKLLAQSLQLTSSFTRRAKRFPAQLSTVFHWNYSFVSYVYFLPFPHRRIHKNWLILHVNLSKQSKKRIWSKYKEVNGPENVHAKRRKDGKRRKQVQVLEKTAGRKGAWHSGSGNE